LKSSAQDRTAYRASHFPAWLGFGTGRYGE